MIGSFWAGVAVQHRLHERHRSRDAIDSIRVVITLLATFAGVVLGLLISFDLARFTNTETGLRSMGVDVIELDRRLRDYGPEVDGERADLIQYLRSAIADVWPDETPPPGAYPRYRLAERNVEAAALEEMLNRVDMGTRRLAPDDPVKRSLASELRSLMSRFMDDRWRVVSNAFASLSWPFLVTVMFWLVVIFGIVGLSSPRNLLVSTVVTLAACSIASSIYLAVDMDTPLTGFIKVSSAPLRDALAHITMPPLPPGVR